jgi:hypothetical protein
LFFPGLKVYYEAGPLPLEGPPLGEISPWKDLFLGFSFGAKAV